MSLINDALNRANQTRPPKLPNAPQAPPLRPVPQKKRPVLWPLIFIPLGLLAVFVTALWFLWHGWQTHLQDRAKSKTPKVVARQTPPSRIPAPAPAAAAPRPTPKPVVRTKPAPPPAPPRPVTAPTPPPVPAAVTTPDKIEPPPPVAAPLAPSKFKLQGLFYRPGKASAVINGKMVFVGDMIDQAEVTAIERNSVTLNYSSQTLVLTLP